MGARHCSTCGARHPINAHRCKKCGAPFMVIDAWTAVMGRAPSLEQVRSMRQHPKFEQLESFEPERLTAAGAQSIVDDGIDVDRWVAASFRGAFARPQREGASDLTAFTIGGMAPLEPPTGRARSIGADRWKIAVAVAAFALVAIVVIVVVNGRHSTTPQPSDNNGKTAVVERSGNQRTNDDVVAEVVHDYCGQGFTSVRVTITRTELHDATGKLVQPAGVETVLQDC